MPIEKSPNHLLKALTLVSLGIHILLFLHISGIYKSKVIKYIELDLKEEESSNRAIPRPPHLFKKDGKPGRQKATRLTPVPTPESSKEYKANVLPVKSLLSAGAVGLMQGGSNLMAGAGYGSSLSDGNGGGGSGSKDGYLEMIRLKVENNNRFPPEAKKERRGGIVTVSFIINLADGTIRDLMIVTPSPFEDLNEQALLAVRGSAPFLKPPAYLFKEDVSIIVDIHFNLM